MKIRQELESLFRQAQSIVLRGIRLIGKIVMAVVTLIVAIVLGVVKAVARAGKLLYVTRDKILGAVLLLATLTAIVLLVNFLIGQRNVTDDVHEWLLIDYRWAIVIGTISLMLLIAWNHVSPTLRTLYGRNWTRLTTWVALGTVLGLLASAGHPQEESAYRVGYVSAAILYVTALAFMAKQFPPKKPVMSESPYIEDNPLEHEEDDLYETQRRVVADIRYLIANGKPSVVAITGHWGIGKTFLLLRAKKEIADDSIIWMKFEPWRYASEEALTLGFYQDIGSQLSGEIPGIQHIIKPLAETTDKFVRQNDNSGVLGMLMDAVRAFQRTADNPELQIQGLLEQEGRRLVIVIDDVERSYDKERIFRTLQLAHFAKSMKNIQVVFLCDKDVILKARPEHFNGHRQDAAEYLEKFIEREVVVPTPRPAELRELFTLLMKSHADIHINFEDDDLPDEMLDAIATPRGIIRLYNELAAFKTNLEEGGDE